MPINSHLLHWLQCLKQGFYRIARSLLHLSLKRSNIVFISITQISKSFRHNSGWNGKKCTDDVGLGEAKFSLRSLKPNDLGVWVTKWDLILQRRKVIYDEGIVLLINTHAFIYAFWRFSWKICLYLLWSHLETCSFLAARYHQLDISVNKHSTLLQWFTDISVVLSVCLYLTACSSLFCFILHALRSECKNRKCIVY